jgi:hypothetical protein
MGAGDGGDGGDGRGSCDCCKSMYLVRGVEIEYSSDGKLTKPTYEALGRVFDNIEKLTPHVDLTRTQVRVKGGEIFIGEYWGGGSSILNIKTKGEKVVETFMLPRAYMMGKHGEFEKVVKKVFPRFKIEPKV